MGSCHPLGWDFSVKQLSQDDKPHSRSRSNKHSGLPGWTWVRLALCWLLENNLFPPLPRKLTQQASQGSPLRAYSSASSQTHAKDGVGVGVGGNGEQSKRVCNRNKAVPTPAQQQCSTPTPDPFICKETQLD